MQTSLRTFALIAASLGMSLAPLPAHGSTGNVDLDVHQFRIVRSESGPTNYYAVGDDPVDPFVRAQYRPGTETAVFGISVPDPMRKDARELRWTWRAQTFPRDGSVCRGGSGIADSAALVYAIWKRGLRYYSLRYVWSTNAPKGSVCDQKRNPFLAQDTVVLESGGPTGQWVPESVDLKAEFRKHFAGGDPNAEIPNFLGVGIMTDGDQSRTESAADYADFALGT
jgi:hypothetical protein